MFNQSEALKVILDTKQDHRTQF